MDQHQSVWNEKVAAKVIQNLEKRRMAGSYAATATQAKEEIIAMIPQGASVYRCSSFEGQMIKDRIHVKLVGELIGY